MLVSTNVESKNHPLLSTPRASVQNFGEYFVVNRQEYTTGSIAAVEGNVEESAALVDLSASLHQDTNGGDDHRANLHEGANGDDIDDDDHTGRASLHDDTNGDDIDDDSLAEWENNNDCVL